MEMDEKEEKEAKDENKPQENGAFEYVSKNTVDSVKEKIQVLLEKTPNDFGAWTLLISEIERTSPNDIKRICLVYDKFLSEFPLCCGYWKKYANHKARLCTYSEVEEVFKRAVQAAAYSVDLWVSYCSFAISSYEDPVDIRRLFQRGLSFVGKDYMCHLLWDKYIEFEYSQKQWSCLAHIYINTLRFPIKKLHSYYDSFKKLVAMWEEEIESQNCTKFSSQAVANGETIDVTECEYSGTLNVVRDLLDQQNWFLRPNAVKKYLKIGELLYHRSSIIESKICNFESQIRRRYFHVKPLDSCQLENWHRYLDFVEMQGDFDWTVKLYERCLIPCANYSEFWIRYSEFVNAKGGREIANYALSRAQTVFLKAVPAFKLYCAMFKEQTGDIVGARALFPKCGASLAPELVENVSRQANMEKRMGNVEAAYKIYEKAIETAKEKQNLQILSVLYINFARFAFVASGSIDTAGEVFIKGIQQAPCKSIIEAFIQFITLHGGAGQMPKLDSIVVNAIAPESDLSRALSDEDREDISRLFLEFMDLYGTIHEIRKAWDRHWKLFPHIMRPTYYYTATEKSNINNESDGRLLVAPSHHASEDNSHGGSDEHLMDYPSKDTADMHPERATICTVQPDEDKSGTGAIICKLQPEEVKSDMEREEKVAFPKVQEQSILEGADRHEVVHECPAIAQIPNSSSEQSEIKNQVVSSPDRETCDALRPSALDNLSIKSPDIDTQQSNENALHNDIAYQEAITVSDENQIPCAGDMEKAMIIHGLDLPDMKPNTPSRASLCKDDSPLHSASDPLLQEAQTNRQVEMPVQSQANSQHDLLVTGAYSQNASSGSWAQMSSSRQTPEAPSSSSYGHVPSSEPQQRQVHSQMQYPCGVSNSHMPVSQGYPCQPQAWTSMQDQQSNKAESQYQMVATQAYSTGSLAWPVQNMQQQGFAYAQPQPNTCPASQPQSQVYQQAQLTNEQYAYFQTHGFAPHIWHYYQQQLYYLQLQQQQQQNQQTHNHAQQQIEIGQVQQLQQEHRQQQQIPQNQQMLLQMQRQRQNQQQLNQQEPQQHLSPQKNQSQHQQQQQASQIQQQSQQVHHATQQHHLLYVQQQHQLYLQQQQQLYMQQQLFQQHLLHHHQQQQQQQQQQEEEPQQVVQQQQLVQQQQQQQQQLLQQQQQQQLLLLQQQQQQLLLLQRQQQQISASQIQTSNNDFHLQHIPVQYANQQGQDNGQEADTSKGEEAKLLDAEQSGSYPATPQHRLF